MSAAQNMHDLKIIAAHYRINPQRLLVDLLTRFTQVELAKVFEQRLREIEAAPPIDASEPVKAFMAGEPLPALAQRPKAQIAAELPGSAQLSKRVRDDLGLIAEHYGTTYRELLGGLLASFARAQLKQIMPERLSEIAERERTAGDTSCAPVNAYIAGLGA